MKMIKNLVILIQRIKTMIGEILKIDYFKKNIRIQKIIHLQIIRKR